MMFKLLSATALAGLLVAAPAAAQRYSTWESGSWSVDSEDGDCLVLVMLPSGGSLGFTIRNDDKDFFVRVATPPAAAAPAGQRFPVTLVLDGQRFSSQGRRLETARGVNTFFTGRGSEILRAFSRANRVSVTVESIETVEIPIDAEAKRQVVKCEAAIGGVGSASEE